MSLATAITAILAHADTMTGIIRAYDSPPDSISEYPSAIAYPLSGTLEAVSSGLAKNLHVIRLDLFAQRTQLAQAVTSVLPWPAELQALLQGDPTLGGAITTVVWPVTYVARPVQYGRESPFAVRFNITVKIMEAI